MEVPPESLPAPAVGVSLREFAAEPSHSSARVGQVGSSYPANLSRRSFFENLPTEVLGTSSMNTTSSGSHHLATFGASQSTSSSFVSVSPGFSTTQASGRSDHLGWLTPITAASATFGWPMIAFSRSTEEIHSPPDLMTSFVRSTSLMYA